MAEPFKNLLNRDGIEQAAVRLARAWPAFDRSRFVRQATEGLEGLEMKARAMQIAAALEATLPDAFDSAASLLESAIGRGGGLEGWILWPVGEFVARRGLDQPERALRTLHALTQAFTAEFAIRPFIVRHPGVVFDTLARWVADPSEHVRRLVSEGSRPRLPWGLRLDALVADPTPTLPLLRALQDDPSEYVRRSVANHLNDIAKDHPAVVAGWLEQHLSGASPERRALLRHASRTLIKAGDRRVLAAWGLDKPFRGQASLRLTPRRVALGQSLELTVHLESTHPRSQKLALDYVVHHVKADGRRTPKVFKGTVLDLPARATHTWVKRHSMREVTTRRYHPGRHAIDIQVNGRVVATAEFDLSA